MVTFEQVYGLYLNLLSVTYARDVAIFIHI